MSYLLTAIFTCTVHIERWGSSQTESDIKDMNDCRQKETSSFEFRESDWKDNMNDSHSLPEPLTLRNLESWESTLRKYYYYTILYYNGHTRRQYKTMSPCMCFLPCCWPQEDRQQEPPVPVSSWAKLSHQQRHQHAVKTMKTSRHLSTIHADTEQEYSHMTITFCMWKIKRI